MTHRLAHARFKKLSPKRADGILPFGLIFDSSGHRPQVPVTFTPSTGHCAMRHHQIPYRTHLFFLAFHPPTALQSP